MRVAVVHGYFLDDSGSGIFVREFTRQLVAEGHEVTLVCQERRPETHDFIDSFYELDPSNSEPRLVFARGTHYGGSCRLVRPDLGGRLLVYVGGRFAGFEAATAFQDASLTSIEAYIEANVRALSTILDRWPQDLIQANHMVMQPCIVRRALSRLGRVRPPRPHYIATVHGSAFSFTVKADARMVPYALEGMAGASVVIAPSRAFSEEVTAFCRTHGLDIARKCFEAPHGVDVERFAVWPDRKAALGAFGYSIDPNADDVLVFAGRLLWTKGLQYAVGALPLAFGRRPRLQLIAAGEGPMLPSLGALIALLERGDIRQARRLTETEPELRGADEFGPVVPSLGPQEETAYLEACRDNLRRRIHFTEHLSHAELAPLYAAADLSLAPSVFPEAFGLIVIEAMSAGALPVATYQTGLRSTLDILAESLGDPGLKRLAPGRGLSVDLADAVVHLLEAYPTRDVGFRSRLHDLAAKRFSWEVIAGRYLELGRPNVAKAG